ncbi:MAG: hypothetical protein LC126_00115 [Bryobacterales bacterium]|nr:hypothetical protein [Bryobacterales bacterium]
MWLTGAQRSVHCPGAWRGDQFSGPDGWTDTLSPQLLAEFDTSCAGIRASSKPAAATVRP